MLHVACARGLKFRAGGAIITSERKRKKEREERKRREKKEKRREGRDQPPFLLFVPLGHHGHYPPPSPRAVAHHSVVPQRGNDEQSVLGDWIYARRNRIGDRVRRTRLPGPHHVSCRRPTSIDRFRPLPTAFPPPLPTPLPTPLPPPLPTFRGEGTMNDLLSASGHTRAGIGSAIGSFPSVGVGRRASTDSGLFPPLPAGVTDAVADAVTDAVTDALFLTNMPLSIIGR